MAGIRNWVWPHRKQVDLDWTTRGLSEQVLGELGCLRLALFNLLACLGLAAILKVLHRPTCGRMATCGTIELSFRDPRHHHYDTKQK